jgi:hypothetical protein
MHQAAIRSLGLIEHRLAKHLPEEKATYYKEKRKENFKHQPSPFTGRQVTKKHDRRTRGIS